MTMLTTIGNLGGKLPSTLALWLVDFLTVKQCMIGDAEDVVDNACRNTEESKVNYIVLFLKAIIFVVCAHSNIFSLFVFICFGALEIIGAVKIYVIDFYYEIYLKSVLYYTISLTCGFIALQIESHNFFSGEINLKISKKYKFPSEARMLLDCT